MHVLSIERAFLHLFKRASPSRTRVLISNVFARLVGLVQIIILIRGTVIPGYLREVRHGYNHGGHGNLKVRKTDLKIGFKPSKKGPLFS